MTETFEYLAEKIAHRRCTQYRNNAGPGEPMYLFTAAHLLDFARELRDELTKGQEPVVIDEPDYHYEAMGCGLEDRNITDRYEAMRYGWDCAVSRMFEQIPDEPLYTRPTVAAPAGVPEGWKLVRDHESADAIVSALYTRFKEWSKRGFGPDDVTWCEVKADILSMLSAAPTAPADAVAKDAELEPVHGDVLPHVGSKVLIHLGRQDAWVEHTVTGYYAWGDLGGNPALHRVFVRVADANGYPNSRLLQDVRPIDAAMQGEKK